MGTHKFTTITVRKVPVSLWKRVKRKAIDRGVPVQQIVTEALGCYLKNGGRHGHS